MEPKSINYNSSLNCQGVIVRIQIQVISSKRITWNLPSAILCALFLHCAVLQIVLYVLLARIFVIVIVQSV